MDPVSIQPGVDALFHGLTLGLWQCLPLLIGLSVFIGICRHVFPRR